MRPMISALDGSLQLTYREKIHIYTHFHAEFEAIHPLSDGNGRMGRVLINNQLALREPAISLGKGYMCILYLISTTITRTVDGSAVAIPAECVRGMKN